MTITNCTQNSVSILFYVNSVRRKIIGDLQYGFKSNVSSIDDILCFGQLLYKKLE